MDGNQLLNTNLEDLIAYWPGRAIDVKSNGMDAPAFNGISCAKVEVSSNYLNKQERPG